MERSGFNRGNLRTPLSFQPSALSLIRVICACPVKYIEDMERSGFNRGNLRIALSFQPSALSFTYLPNLWIKKNSAIRNLNPTIE
jgi:hypothetical protein